MNGASPWGALVAVGVLALLAADSRAAMGQQQPLPPPRPGVEASAGGSPSAAGLADRVRGGRSGPGYDCRTQDKVAGARISAHARGLAVDFVAIAFADQRRLLVERPTGADEASYFRAIRSAACGWFTTVLGPGADAFHANNMHLDIESHGSSGAYRICE